VRRPPAASAAPDGAGPPASPDPLTYLSIALGHPFDPGGRSTAELPVNAHRERQPAPHRCGEHLPQDLRGSRVDGRHESATLKDRMDGPTHARRLKPATSRASRPRGVLTTSG